ncbi:hypothetical protein [Shewanella sp. MTB7]|uniref:hypothetical protein n=1 Tax=Shewanella sp. MTB7 TaxID=2746932 RepID=UPI0022BA6E14|nr:hypothetical protein [Shewanella sp. MTB7]WBJ98029.1 hypothetical protein HWQ47_13490 [Shewanella sp. MTB7]
MKKPPFEMGTPNFNGGSYTPISFTLNIANSSQQVGFSLFERLGSENITLIRTVILFMATMTAGFIVLTSGRKG